MSEPEPEKSTVLPVKPPNIPPESGDESDDESGVLEESPCGRWQKRREEVCAFVIRRCISQSSVVCVFKREMYLFAGLFEE